jgi:methionyl-tRNA formyltransferase
VGVTPKQLLVRGNQLFAGCGVGGVIELLEVQPEGKKRIPAKDFIHGYRPQPGETLDS